MVKCVDFKGVNFCHKDYFDISKWDKGSYLAFQKAVIDAGMEMYDYPDNSWEEHSAYEALTYDVHDNDWSGGVGGRMSGKLHNLEDYEVKPSEKRFVEVPLHVTEDMIYATDPNMSPSRARECREIIQAAIDVYAKS